MRLVVVFFLITFSYAKKSRTLKGVKVKNTDRSLVEELNVRAPVIDERTRNQPVPFGHIYREGFNPSRKDPVDAYESDSFFMEDSDLVQQLIKSGYKNIVPVIQLDEMDGDPRQKDEVSADKKEKQEDMEDKNKTFWHDFAGYQRKNINMSPEFKKMPSLKDLIITRQRYSEKSPPFISDSDPKYKYFDRFSFELGGTKIKSNLTVNWTTCDEFRRKANFHPKDVVDIDWVPFYVWTDGVLPSTSTVHRFTYPTKKLVKQYRDNYAPYINSTIDWEQPKLLLKETMEMLLIASDRRGLYNAIPHIDMPKYVPAGSTISYFQLRLKKVERYLAMMTCDQNYAVLMAVAGSEPTGYIKATFESKILKFKGTGLPIVRNVELEKLTAQLEREDKLKRENDKFIFVENKK